MATRLLLTLALAGLGLGRKHNLNIQEDNRQFIPLSTFGFYTGGKLVVNMTGFHMREEELEREDVVVGFSIDKTVSDALNPYVQATESQCILTKQVAEKEKAGILRFTLDFKNRRTRVKCSKNIRSITILASDSTEADESLGPLSDSQMFRPKRSLNDPNAGYSVEAAMGSSLEESINNYNAELPPGQQLSPGAMDRIRPYMAPTEGGKAAKVKSPEAEEKKGSQPADVVTAIATDSVAQSQSEEEKKDVTPVDNVTKVKDEVEVKEVKGEDEVKEVKGVKGVKRVKEGVPL